jgi:hypothetical protein
MERLIMLNQNKTPTVITKNMEFTLIGCGNQLQKFNHGDIIWLNEASIKALFNMLPKDLPLGEKIEPGFICIEKTKRHHWWQFWKPKYTGAKFMYVEKEN